MSRTTITDFYSPSDFEDEDALRCWGCNERVDPDEAVRLWDHFRLCMPEKLMCWPGCPWNRQVCPSCAADYCKACDDFECGHMTNGV